MGPTIAVLKTGFLIPKTFADFMWPPAIKAGLDLDEVLDSAVKEGLAQVQIEAVARKTTNQLGCGLAIRGTAGITVFETYSLPSISIGI